MIGDPGFTTAAMSAAFSPAARVAAMCRVEGALAMAGAGTGVLPGDVAARIGAICGRGVQDPEAVLAEGWEVGTPVQALLDRLRGQLDHEAAGWLHHGATTQDVVDTALVLQVRDGLDALRADLAALAADLRALVAAHRDTPTSGWTFLQPAVPTTVGRRAAGWLSPITTHLADLRTARAALPVQLGGATGGLDALGVHGHAITRGVADSLGLVVPPIPWHTDRTPLTKVVGLLQQLTRTTATIATDLVLLAHQGSATMRAGGSTAMPGKRNPIDAIRAVAAAEACAGACSVVTAGRPHELERGIGGWHAEWHAVPTAFCTAGASAEALARAVSTLQLVGDVVEGGPATGHADARATPAASGAIDAVLTACDEELSRS